MTPLVSMIRRLMFALLAATMVMGSPVLRAEIVTTDALTTASQADQDRAKIQSFMDRATVAEKLKLMGVEGILAKDRVNALSEQEAHAMAERIDAMPAGGNLSQSDMILILLIAILVAIAL